MSYHAIIPRILKRNLISSTNTMTYNNLITLTPSYSWNTFSVIENTNMPLINPNTPGCSFTQNAAGFTEYSAYRKWETVGRSKRNSTSNKNALHFRVMSYNILAQILLEFHSYLYSECEEINLNWNIRFSRIFNEISTQDPDVLCLQEVQEDHVNFLNSHMRKQGYNVIYKQRTGIRVDGCAIFYKSAVFDLIDHESVEFRQPHANILDRDNIGLMVKLRPKIMPSIPFIVCTTHLLYNPKRTNIRLAQVQVFLAEIDRFSFYNDNTHTAQHLPVIITGDFNSFPDSPVVKLLMDGKVSLNSSSGLRNISVTDSCQHLGVYLQRRNEANLNDNEVSKLFHSEKKPYNKESDVKYRSGAYESFFNQEYIRHKFRLQSVYDFVDADNEYEVTTHQNDWVTVDYIFYTPGTASNLILTERYRLPTVRECHAMGAIPNKLFGSDHFALAAGFILKPVIPSSSV